MSSSEEELSGEEGASSEEEEVVFKRSRKTKKNRKKNKSKKMKKDPNRPKRFQTAFFLYCNANRPRVKSLNPDVSFGDVARLLTAEFKSLSRRDLASWQQAAERDKARYQAEMERYVPPPDSSDSEQSDSSDDDDDDRYRGKKKVVDPNRPKRNVGPFLHFSNANRDRIRQHNPGASFGDVAKLLSMEFMSLSTAQRAQWQALADQDKRRYQAEMRHYVPPSDLGSSDSDSGSRDGGGRKRKRKAKKKRKVDPNKPKRGQTPFFLYSNANRSRVKAENPDASFGDVARILTAEFKSLSPRDLEGWQVLAEQEKIRYQEEMSRYVPPPEYDEEERRPSKKKKKKSKKSSSSSSKKKKKPSSSSNKKKRDPNAPKIAMGPFHHYSNYARADVRARHPHADFGEVVKMLASQYRRLSKGQKARFQRMAMDDKERYAREMAAYEAGALMGDSYYY